MKRRSSGLVVVALWGAGCLDVGGGEDVGSTSQAASVTWTNVVRAIASGYDLTKSDPGGKWNAGAVSVDSLAADGYVQFTTGEATTAKMAGLGNGDTNQNYTDIEFAIHLKANGAVAVREAGVVRGTFGTYVAGDLFRVAVEAGVVSYKKNGIVFYTSAIAPTFPLVADTSLFTDGATIRDVVLTPTRPTWQNLVGVTITGGLLTKTASGGWNAGASSVEPLAGDGFVEFTAGENTTARIAGLSNGDSGQGYADIDHGVYLKANGAFSVYESGVLRAANFGTYAAGDRFRVAVEGGVVQYSKNGATPFYTSAVPPTFPLLVDTSFNTPGATLRDFAITDAVDTCPAYDGGGLTCGGSFTVTNEFDLAEIADCAEITGNLVIAAPGLATIALPKLELVGGVLSVSGNTTLVRLLLPELKQVVGSLRLYYFDAATEVDLSRLRTGSTIEAGPGQTSLRLPCLLDLSEHLAVALPLSAPRLATVAGNVNMYTGQVAPTPLSAPSLGEIGGVLAYTDTMDLPALTQVGGLIAKAGVHPALVRLPALREVTGMLIAGTSWDGWDETRVSCSTRSPSYAISLPALERVGSLVLCTKPEQADLPALRLVTGPSYPLSGTPVGLQIGPNGSTSAPALSLPALEDVTGNVTLYLAVALPALARIDGALGIGYYGPAVDAPVLQEVTGDLGANISLSAPQLAVVGGTLSFSTPIDLPLLGQVGGLVASSRSTQDGLVTPPVDLPSLRVVTGALSMAVWYETYGLVCRSSLPYAVSLPELRRVGSLVICSAPSALDLPRLRFVTGPPFQEPGFGEPAVLIDQYPYGSTSTVRIPALEDVNGKVITMLRAELPSLGRIQGAAHVWAPMTAPALQEIQGDLEIRNEGFSADALVTVGGDLRTYDSQTVSLPALTSARSIDASQAASLTTLDLPALSTTTGPATEYSIRINSTMLTTIAMPALTALPGSLQIRANSLLTSLDFPLLTSLGPKLIVRGNPRLPTCYPTDIVAQLQAAGWTGTWTVQGNDDDGTCQ